MIIHFIILVIQILSLSLSAQANMTDEQVANTCPISFEFNQQETYAYDEYKMRLGQVDGALGRPHFERRLQEILGRLNPEQRVIDVSPYFTEKLLYLVDQKYLEDSIVRSIGKQTGEWNMFGITMRNMLSSGLPTTDSRNLARRAEDLVRAIQRLTIYNSRHFASFNYSTDEAALIKAKAAALVTNMWLTLEYINNINAEIRRQNTQAFFAGLPLQLIRIGTAGVLVATTIYAGPIVAITAGLARGLVADAALSLYMARIGQAVAGGVIGAAGAPAGLAVYNTSQAIMVAQRNSLNNRTLLACELNEQFSHWRSQGISPYLSASLVGGSIGLSLTGSIAFLPRVGAQALLSVASFGVAVAQLYSVGKMTENHILSLHEYRLAMTVNEAGNKEQALVHLRASRDYAQLAGERAVQSVIIGVLSASVGATFRSALVNGQDEIATILANSSDTLPMALQVAGELAVSVRAQ